MRKVIKSALLLLAISVLAMAGSVQAASVSMTSSQDAAIASGGGWDSFPGNAFAYIMFNPEDATSSLGLVQFDLSAIPASANITSATMTLYHEYNSQNGVSIDVHRVTSAWNESAVDYTTQPSFDSTVVSSLAIADSNQGVYRTWDLTSLAQGWVNGSYSNFGLLLMRNPDQASWPYFASKEDTNPAFRPLLEVEYQPVPEPSSLTFLLAGVPALLAGLRRRVGR